MKRAAEGSAQPSELEDACGEVITKRDKQWEEAKEPMQKLLEELGPSYDSLRLAIKDCHVAQSNGNFRVFVEEVSYGSFPTNGKAVVAGQVVHALKYGANAHFIVPAHLAMFMEVVDRMPAIRRYKEWEAAMRRFMSAVVAGKADHTLEFVLLPRCAARKTPLLEQHEPPKNLPPLNSVISAVTWVPVLTQAPMVIINSAGVGFIDAAGTITMVQPRCGVLQTGAAPTAGASITIGIAAVPTTEAAAAALEGAAHADPFAGAGHGGIAVAPIQPAAGNMAHGIAVAAIQPAAGNMAHGIAVAPIQPAAGNMSRAVGGHQPAAVALPAGHQHGADAGRGRRGGRGRGALAVALLVNPPYGAGRGRGAGRGGIQPHAQIMAPGVVAGEVDAGELVDNANPFISPKFVEDIYGPYMGGLV